MTEDQAEPELALEVQVRTNYLFISRCTTTLLFGADNLLLPGTLVIEDAGRQQKH